MADPHITDNDLVIRSVRPLTPGRVPYTTIPGFLLDDPKLTRDALLALLNAPAVVDSGGMVPYLLEDDETFTVPIKKQGLFAMTINVQGTLVIDGYLVQVD